MAASCRLVPQSILKAATAPAHLWGQPWSIGKRQERRHYDFVGPVPKKTCDRLLFLDRKRIIKALARACERSLCTQLHFKGNTYIFVSLILSKQ